MELFEVFFVAIKEYWGFIVSEVTLNYDYKPIYQNYFYGLIVVCLIVWGLELMFPWRKNQAAIRKDFWLDGFYMFFNFFIFGLMISGFYAVLAMGLGSAGITMASISLFDFAALPLWECRRLGQSTR